MTTGRRVGSVGEDNYEASEITLDNTDYLLMATTYNHGKTRGTYRADGWNKLSVKARISYMRLALSTGLVGTEHSARAVATIQNLEGQLS